MSLWSDTFSVTLDFQDGNGAMDVTSLAKRNSFTRKRRIWNKLAPTVNTASFLLRFNATINNLLMTTDDDILVAVTKNSTAWFTGVVRPNFEVPMTSRPDDTRIECVDRGLTLQKKIMTSISWSSYDVCKPSGTATSIIHQLMVSAGYTTSDVAAAIPAIAVTIGNFIIVAGERTYWDVLQQLAFEFGYVFYFQDDGKLNLYNFAPSSVSAGANVLDNSKLVDELRLVRTQRDYDGARVKWWEIDTFGSVVVASDVTGATGTFKCLIPLTAGQYYPDDSDTKDVYIDYSYKDYQLVGVTAAKLDLKKDSGVVLDTFTDQMLRAKLKIHNGGSTPAYITRLDVVGNAICKTVLNWTESPNPLTSDKVLDIDTQWVNALSDAQKLARAVSRYYRYASFLHKAKSRTAFNPGDFVAVQETSWLSINNTCVVVEVIDDLFTEVLTYQLEGIAAYSADTTQTYAKGKLGATEELDIAIDGGAAATTSWEFSYDGGEADSWA